MMEQASMGAGASNGSADRTSSFFDGYARDFSDIYGNKNTLFNSIINEVFRKSMKLRYLKTLAGCEPIVGRTVLDIGCGPGHYGIELARRGAASVYGVDFAQGMIDLAEQHAARAGVKDRCKFELKDFHLFPADVKFDYAIVMGFMDYMSDPRKVVAKVLSFTNRRAFFSFPIDGGVLAWQRKLRYKSRCDLYMYSKYQIRDLFSGLPHQSVEIEKAARDYFVTVTMP
jgi:cyclopropane fatty-acyl-phospholipid synthase-like methyltransferase